MAFLAGGRLERLSAAADIPELAGGRLLALVERCAAPARCCRPSRGSLRGAQAVRLCAPHSSASRCWVFACCLQSPGCAADALQPAGARCRRPQTRGQAQRAAGRGGRLRAEPAQATGARHAKSRRRVAAGWVG